MPIPPVPVTEPVTDIPAPLVPVTEPPLIILIPLVPVTSSLINTPASLAVILPSIYTPIPLELMAPSISML